MENNNYTIHIFGYGETQINSKELSIKEPTSSLTKVQALIDAIWAKKPSDSLLVEKKYHAINIFNGNDIRWQTKDGFNIKNEEGEFNSLLDELIAELQVKKDAQTA